MAGWDSLEEGDQRRRRQLSENVARRGIVSGVESTTSAACMVDGPGVLGALTTVFPVSRSVSSPSFGNSKYSESEVKLETLEAALTGTDTKVLMNEIK